MLRRAFSFRALHFVVTLAVCSVSSACTLLVSFDQKGDAGCDGACGDDGMIRLDSHVVDVVRTLDVATSHDTGESADVGNCSVLDEGAPCGKPSTCNDASTCRGGVCAANPLPDGTQCGGAPDMCHVPPVCMLGACAPALAANEGMTCGSAPSGPCQLAPTCKEGKCTPVNRSDGVVCGSPPAPCQSAPTCSGGVCNPNNMPDGTSCGTGGGSACIEPFTCEGGQCVTPNVKDGTVCGTAADACHAAPVCEEGVCQPAATQPDGTSASTSDPNLLCCSGAAVDVTTSQNCGVCGWTCSAGQTCSAFTSDGNTFYVCEGCTVASDCFSGCCSTNPTPNHCSAGNCNGACQSPDVCTGGSMCSNSGGLIHCEY